MDVDDEGLRVGPGKGVVAFLAEEFLAIAEPGEGGCEGDGGFGLLGLHLVGAYHRVLFPDHARPEVVAVHIPVGEPEAAVVGVVFFLGRGVVLHGPMAGDVGAGGGGEWIEVGDSVVGAVGGDQLVAVVDRVGAVLLLDAELRMGGDSQKGGEYRCEGGFADHVIWVN